MPVRYLIPATLLSCTLSLTACTTPVAVQPPQLSVESIRLEGITLQPPTANIALRIAIENPNAVGLKMANIASEIIVNGKKIADLALPDVNVPATGRTIQPAKLNVPINLDALDTVLKVARGEQVSYRLDGKFTADLGVLGRPTFGPFTLAQGLWKQERILPF